MTIGRGAAMAPSRCRASRRPVKPHQLIAGGARCFEASRPVRGHAASRPSAFLQRAADLIKESERIFVSIPASFGRIRSWRRAAYERQMRNDAYAPGQEHLRFCAKTAGGAESGGVAF